MKEKIYKYLKERPEGASASDLFEKFFHIYGSHPKKMEKILTDMLSSDARFVKDKTGIWQVNTTSTKTKISNSMFLLIDFQFIKLGRRTETPIAMGICQIKNLKIIKSDFLKVDFSEIYGFDVKRNLSREKTYFAHFKDFQEISEELFNICQNSILVSISPYKHQEWLNALFRHQNGLDIEFTAISLRELFYHVFPEFPGKDLSDMLRATKISYLELTDIKSRIDAQVDLLFELLQSKKLRNIDDIESLIKAISEKQQWVDFNKYHFNREFLQSIPSKPGVYFFLDENDSIFYVGKSKNLNSRVSSYFVNRRAIDEKHKIILDKVKKIHYQLVGSELEALLLENESINKNKPLLNVQIKIKPIKREKYKNKQYILFLPGVGPDEAFLLFVDGICCACSLIVNRESSQLDKICQKEIEKIFFDKNKYGVGYSPEQIEIIWRWFELNKENINYLNVNDFSSINACTMAAVNYLKDPNLFSSHVLYQES